MLFLRNILFKYYFLLLTKENTRVWLAVLDIPLIASYQFLSCIRGMNCAFKARTVLDKALG